MYLKPGMFGVPPLMNSRITSAIPPSESLDRMGPYCPPAASWTLTWQTMQCWANKFRPANSLSLRGTAACCATASCGQAANDNSSIHALHFMGRSPEYFGRLLRLLDASLRRHGNQ